MMNYTNLETNDRSFKMTKIIITTIIIIGIISSLIYIYMNNDGTTKNIRRKIDLMEGDITNLYNYTETMSDFIVGDYKISNPSNDFKVLLKTINELKSEFYRNQMDFKNSSLKVQMDLKKDFDDFKDEINNNQMDIKKLMIRKTAIEFLNKIGFNQNDFFTIKSDYYYDNHYNNMCFKAKFMKIDFNEIYEKLLKIDYDKFIISFAYLSDNRIENFKLHPIYKLINETLEFDYEYLTDISCDYFNECFRTNNGYYYKPAFINKIPYIKWCNYEPFIVVGRDNQLSKIYDEYEYISRIVSFTSIPPQRFL